MTKPPLNSMSPTTRFSDRVDDYARYRPSYPPGVLDRVLEGLTAAGGAGGGGGGSQELRAVDLGAGTGIFSRLLADRGVRVIAVEPNAAMRTAGEAVPHANVEWRNGTAESTGVPDGWADLVIAAQAWHWFEPVATGREVLRVLRTGGASGVGAGAAGERGRLAVVWNADDPDDAATCAFRAVMQAHATTQRVHQEMIDAESVRRLGWGTPVREVAVGHAQRLDAGGLVGRARSASYAPKDAAALASMTRGLQEVFERFAVADDRPGQRPSGEGSGRFIELRYVARAFITERPA